MQNGYITNNKLQEKLKLLGIKVKFRQEVFPCCRHNKKSLSSTIDGIHVCR